MKNLLAVVVAGAVSLAFSHSVRGDTDFVIFKAAVSLQVLYVDDSSPTGIDKQLTKMLTGKEVINLSMGRALDFTPAGPKSEMIAVAVAYEDDGQVNYAPQVTVATPKTRVILWNPQAPLLANRWVKTLATLTELEYDRLFTSGGEKGQGIATLVIPEGAPIGGTADNKFYAITLHGTGKLTQTTYFFPFPPGPPPGGPGNGDLKTIVFSATGLGGRVKFNFTDSGNPTPGKLINGVVVKGKVTTTGAPLGALTRNE